MKQLHLTLTIQQSKSVTLKYNDGNGANQAGTIAKIDLSGLADQIKDGYSFSTDAKGNVVGNHAVTAVGNGKTVSMRQAIT